MTGKRKLFMSKEKSKKDRVAKIKKNPKAHNAIFIYDKRTKSVRLQSDRHFVLSGVHSAKGKCKHGSKVILRKMEFDSQLNKD